ncbi:unnamed protein product [Notodromas monacha]|uniref:S1 motif domain-containing protein n=1 Tax=Notodromas monacha TaxID=399045 RepID=A0A7R9BH39_9CRUS|nr:unnamed protein product [Notodromas monacha]CAG0913780.1 unnamed protein product [Notodromas monacha]
MGGLDDPDVFPRCRAAPAAVQSGLTQLKRKKKPGASSSESKLGTVDKRAIGHLKSRQTGISPSGSIHTVGGKASFSELQREPHAKPRRNSGRENLRKLHGEPWKAEIACNRSGTIGSLPAKSVSTDGVLIAHGHYLCSVERIHDDKVDVLLPGGLKSAVLITEISDAYTMRLTELSEEELANTFLEDLFQAKQLLSCRVYIEDGKRIASFNPRRVNEGVTSTVLKPGFVLQGAVSSLEGSKIEIDVGIEGVQVTTSTESMKKLEEWLGKKIGVGHILWCAIVNVSGHVGGLSVKVSVDPKEVSKATVVKAKKLTLQSLKVGLLVECTISSCEEDGSLKVKIFNRYDAIVPREHRRKPAKKSPGLEPGTLIVGRIFVNRDGCCIVSLRDFICKNLSCSSLSWESTEMTVGKVGWTTNEWLFAKISEDSFGIVSMQEFSKSASKNPAIGSNISMRFIRPFDIDGIAMFSTEDKTYEEISSAVNAQVGDLVAGTITEASEDGIILDLPLKGTGFIPLGLAINWYADNRKKKILAKWFPVGKELRCRVWSVAQGRLTLACHVAVLKYADREERNFLSVTEDHVGRVIPLLVTRIQKTGAVCSTFNDVQCFLPWAHIEDRNVCSRGKLVLAKVLNVADSSMHPSIRITCSMKSENEPSVGECLSHVKLNAKKNDHFVVSGEYRLGEVSGIIPEYHLSDFPDLAEAWFALLQEGAELKGVRLWSNQQGKKIYTCKQSICQIFKAQEENIYPKINTELKEGQLISGVVQEIAETMLKLQLPLQPPANHGSVYLRNASDLNVGSLQDLGGVAVGSSVLGRVIRVLNRQYASGAELTLSPFNVLQNPKEAGRHLEKYFDQYDVFCNASVPLLVEKKLTKPDWLGRITAKLVSGKAENTDHQFLVKVGKGVDSEISAAHVIIPPSRIDGIKIEKGEKLECISLFYRLSDKKLFLLPRCFLEESGGESEDRHGKVLLCERQFVVLLAPGKVSGWRVVFAPSQVHLCDVVDRRGMFLVDDDVPISAFPVVHEGRWILPYPTKAPRKHPKEPLETKKRADGGVESSFAKSAGKKRRAEIDDENGKDLKRERTESTSDVDILETEHLEKKNQKISETSSTKESKKRKKSSSKSLKNEEESEEPKAKTSNNVSSVQPGLFVGSKFEWINPLENFESSRNHLVSISNVDDEKETKVDPKKEEEITRRAEMELMDPLRAPRTTEDFDRLVLCSPNSSICWIKYMVFHLQGGEVDEAREVAKRALKTINFREEQERLNVWTALLNMENLYGTPDSMEAAFKEALQTNDQLSVFRKTVEIYEESHKHEKVAELFEKMVKKFKSNKDVWIDFAAFYMRIDKLEDGRTVFNRCLKSLASPTHLDVMSKWAQLELKHGDPERGKTLYEKLLKTFPKRMDILNVYIDALVKFGNVDGARAVLEKMTLAELPMKKMQAVFKKYIAFESTHGSAAKLQAVKDQADAYLRERTEAQ